MHMGCKNTFSLRMSNTFLSILQPKPNKLFLANVPNFLLRYQTGAV